jgi:hypothetical protein
VFSAVKIWIDFIKVIEPRSPLKAQRKSLADLAAAYAYIILGTPGGGGGAAGGRGGWRGGARGKGGRPRIGPLHPGGRLQLLCESRCERKVLTAGEFTFPASQLKQGLNTLKLQASGAGLMYDTIVMEAD